MYRCKCYSSPTLTINSNAQSVSGTSCEFCSITGNVVSSKPTGLAATSNSPQIGTSVAEVSETECSTHCKLQEANFYSLFTSHTSICSCFNRWSENGRTEGFRSGAACDQTPPDPPYTVQTCSIDSEDPSWGSHAEQSACYGIRSQWAPPPPPFNACNNKCDESENGVCESLFFEPRARANLTACISVHRPRRRPWFGDARGVSIF